MRALVTAAVLAAVVGSLLAFPSRLSAQSLLVQVAESETGRPIPGAFVSLQTEGGEVLRSALTNESGRLLFQLTQAGVFRIEAEMIGRETAVSLPVTVEGDESASVSLALPVYAIPLEGIRVEAEEQCRIRPDEAPQISRVWEEARKALTVQAWAEHEGLYHLEISTYERRLDARGMRVEGEHRQAATLFTRTPFVSLPAEDLMSGGFVREAENGGHEYYGPDAAVLLSDAFLEGHCFRLRRSADLPGSIGLGFEEARPGEIPDIQGTLWLDQQTAELQFLEYAYTWAPYRTAEGIAGGRIEFQPMPNGAWIVSRWWIQAPILAQHFDLVRAGDSGIRVTGILETGGEVVGVSTLDEQRVTEVPRGAITGRVWDSTRFAPLGGATVYLSGTQYAAVSGADGRFLMEGVPEGVFSALFTHARLDTLGIFPAAKEVSVALGRATDMDFGVPAMETILVETCRAQEGKEAGGALTGMVLNRAGGEPVPGARVRLEWQEVTGEVPAVQDTDRWMEVSSDSEGRYTACGLPLGESIFVSATFMDTRSTTEEVGFTGSEHLTLTLTLNLPVGFISTSTDVTGWVEEFGVQGVQGVLQEPGSGEPIRSAEVTIQDPSGRVRVTGLTNRRGFFRLQTPVPGRFVFSAQALGYAEVENQVVEVPRGYLAVLSVQMAPTALELEPLVVTAEARAFHLEMEGFYERQTHGASGGLFITPEKLEQRSPGKLTDVFFGLPGTRVIESSTGAGGRAVYFSRSGLRLDGRICWPVIYVDRHLASTGGLSGADPTALDTFVHGSEVAAVEVYRSAAEIPSEFNSANAGCGVIVVWTKRGGGG